MLGLLSVCWALGQAGLSSPCSLFCSFASGCVALPVLMNIKAVMEQRQCSGVWSHKDELPVRPSRGRYEGALGRTAPQEGGLTPLLASPD